MNKISLREVELLSAYLDGQTSPKVSSRLEVRIKSDPGLAAALHDLRQARNLLRHTPQRRAPRNFTLSPLMKTLRPPLPRAVPVLSWASAVAMLFSVFTLGTSLLGQLAAGAAAPMLASAPMTREGYGFGGGPAATEVPAMDSAQTSPTGEAFVMAVPAATDAPQARGAGEIPDQKAPQPSSPTWPGIWLGVAGLLILAALLLRWLNRRAFLRRISPHPPGG